MILLLSKDLDISVVSDGYRSAVLNFHGKIVVDYDVVGDLLTAGLISTGYRTGRIKPEPKNE